MLLSNDNLDKVVKILSSNLYENYFSVLVKFTEGKRISTDKSNNWIVLQNFLAGLRTNADFSSMLLNKVGTCANGIINKRKEVLSRRKNYVDNHCKLKSTMEGRKLHRQHRNNLIGKYQKCSSKYKIEKLKNKDFTDNMPNQNKDGNSMF